MFVLVPLGIFFRVAGGSVSLSCPSQTVCIARDGMYHHHVDQDAGPRMVVSNHIHSPFCGAGDLQLWQNLLCVHGVWRVPLQPCRHVVAKTIVLFDGFPTRGLTKHLAVRSRQRQLAEAKEDSSTERRTPHDILGATWGEEP
jgi:hypothetical protein